MKDFEIKMNKLQDICEKMGSDTLSLSDGLALYEEGIALVKYLEAQMARAEQKVEQLLNDDVTDKAAEPRLQLFETNDSTK